MFFEYEITGSYIWGNETVNNEELQRDIIKYTNGLEKYYNGDYPIAICLNRGPKAIICMLALLENGIPFVNIDKLTPIHRIQEMLDILKVKYMITDDKFEGVQVEKIDIQLVPLELKREQHIEKKSRYAYYLFTSGTTGKPKAVPILRESLKNFFDGMSKIFEFKKNQRIINLTSYSFDIVFLEVLYSFYVGLSVVLTSDKQISNIGEICKLLVEKQVDIIQMTPSRLKMFSIYDKGLESFKNLNYILIGGEQFPIESLKKLQKCTTARIFNMYGPTETTIWSTVSELTNKVEIDIGQPIVNTEIYIMNSKNVLNNGEVGEICIGGRGLSTGYICMNQEQNKAFQEVCIDEVMTRIYRTGDLGYIDSEGNIICHGRTDNQIKLNGHRIELEDIDCNINKLDMVIQSTTCFDKVDNCLTTIYIAKKEIDEKKFRETLSIYLPEYMIPQRYVRVDEFEYTLSGKLDRNRMLQKVRENRVNNEEANNLICQDKFQAVFTKYGIVEFDYDMLIQNVVNDSIVFLEILVELEDIFEFEFDIEALDMSYYVKVYDLYNYVLSNLKDLRA